jgi:hypothetical protein
MTGGLVGRLEGSRDWWFSGTVEFSSATGDVYGQIVTGGLVGNNAGNIRNSFATGNVTGTWMVGGLVGWNESFREARNVFASGNVTGRRATGGLVGANRLGIVLYGYSTGEILGEDMAGQRARLVGENNSESNRENTGTIRYSYAAGVMIGSDYSYKVAVSSEDVATEKFWREILGWDFEEVWIWDADIKMPILRPAPEQPIHRW